MKKDTLITGLALFAMFFGAGNLIFPPFLGMESGTDWVIGFLCFILIDVHSKTFPASPPGFIVLPIMYFMTIFAARKRLRDWKSGK